MSNRDEYSGIYHLSHMQEVIYMDTMRHPSFDELIREAEIRRQIGGSSTTTPPDDDVPDLSPVPGSRKRPDPGPNR